MRLDHAATHVRWTSMFKMPIPMPERALLERDVEGRTKCFFYNNYGHVKKHYRKRVTTRQTQNV